MTTEWKIVCDDNTKLLTNDEYSGSWNLYEGTGIYSFQLPHVFYDNAQFCVTANLNAPNAPNNMICQIRYYYQVPPSYNNNKINLGMETNSIIICYDRPFISGLTDKSSLYNIRKHGNGWASFITINFVVPNDINKFRENHQNNKYVYPGKDWKLTLLFVFEDVNKITEKRVIDSI